MPQFNGSDGDDVFTGGADNDTAIGNAGKDALSGDGGNDVLVGNSGSDTLNGGDGDDRLFGGNESPPYILAYFGNPGTSPLLDTGTEQDTLNGGDGGDTIFAGYGDNVDGGDDGNFGDRLLISFLGAPSGISVDFYLATQTIGGGTITGIENISWVQGSNFDDRIVIGMGNGYSDRNSVFGMGGNDLLIAGYNTGVLDGGEGDDIVDGRDSSELLAVYGGAGDDIIYTNANGFGLAHGGDGNDTIYAHRETHGGDGNDRIVMSLSNQFSGAVVHGDAGDDQIDAASTGNTVAGGSGADIITGNQSGDRLGSSDFVTNSTTAFVDDMGLERDVLAGSGGNDFLAIGYGDSAYGGTGTDTLRLSLGGHQEGIIFSTNGIVSGQPFTLGGGTVQNIETLEYLRGTEFADSLTLATQGSLLTVNAGAGNDAILSQGSAVELSGGDGNDIFYTGSAGDFFDGGNGIDAILYVQATSGVTVALGLNGAIGTGTGGDRLINVENVIGSYQDDRLTGNEQANQLFGEAGADTLSGGAGNDYLYGGEGDDALVGDTGNDILEGGTGTDTMTGGLGDDLYYVNVLQDVVSETGPEGGNDVVISRAAHFILPANFEILQLIDPGGHSSGHGNEQDNYLTGNSGNNSLNGFGGNDTLSGWDGDDVLTGGAGDDSFQGTAAHLDGDTIADFTRGDRIVISDANLASFTFSLSGNALTYTGGSLTLGSLPASRIVATAAAGGGVQLAIAADARHDFNGDGRSDLALLNSSSSFTSWLGQPNGSFANNPGSGANALGTSWRVAGSGDFNGDGRDDILWRHSSGEIGEWLGQSNGIFTNNGGAAANPVDNSWMVAGVADHNGDDRADIMWRHSSGEVGQWLGQPNGDFANNGGAAANTVDLSWSIAASGDFNGDGRGDILWRHSGGTFAEWQGTASGALVNAGSVLAGASGSVVGSGDFNGDGRDDPLMRATSGSISLWLGQSSGQFASFAPTQQLLDRSWKIVAIGDYDGDGNDDLLWRHASGEAIEWLATGTGDFVNNGALPTIEPSWQIQSPDILLV